MVVHDQERNMVVATAKFRPVRLCDIKRELIIINANLQNFNL